MIFGVVLLILMHKITVNWIYSGKKIFYDLRKVLQLFISVLSPTAMNINNSRNFRKPNLF